MAKINFTGVDPYGRPLGFTESLDTFQEVSYIKSSADDIFNEPVKEQETIDEPVKGDPEEPCPDPSLPAPPPCHRYEQYYVEGSKCPEYRLVLIEDCTEENIEQPTDTVDTGVPMPKWETLDCDGVLAAIQEIENFMMVIRSEQAYNQAQQQLEIGKALIQKKCQDNMEPTYTMLNWKSMGCEFIPSAINDLKFMVSQAEASTVDLKLMQEDIAIGEEFYKANCGTTDGGGLVTVDDLFGGTGGVTPVDETPKEMPSDVPADQAPTDLKAPENTEVVEMGPSKKSYTWIYIAAAAAAFFLLTRRR